MTPDEIKSVLEKHKLWSRGDPHGSKADLSKADLSKADLSRADLSGADLSGADLRWADLSKADLSKADLSGADLSGADLSGADLSGADLSGADLSKADLSKADLSKADLRWADLSGANLSGADLSKAENKDLSLARMEIVPREGTFTGWKKCRNNVLVKVQVPIAAKRSNATGRKCRAEFIVVLEVLGDTRGVSIYDVVTKYRVGETVRADKWEPNRLIECGGGIHFYLTKEEAEAHT